MRSSLLGILFVFSLLHSSVVMARDFLYWEDDEGALHFVDERNKVPLKFRDRAKPVRASYGDVFKSTRTIFRFAPDTERVVLPASLNNKIAARLLLDQGTEKTVISTNSAIKLGINPSDPNLPKIDGVPQVRLEILNVRGRKVTNILVSISDRAGYKGYDGKLGKDFLKNFRVDLDLREGKLLLEDKVVKARSRVRSSNSITPRRALKFTKPQGPASGSSAPPVVAVDSSSSVPVIKPSSTPPASSTKK